MDTEEGDIGHPDEGPPLTGPEHDDGAPLRGLSGSVEIGEAHAAQVGGQADKDMPAGEWDVRQQVRHPALTATSARSWMFLNMRPRLYLSSPVPVFASYSIAEEPLQY